MFAARFVAPLLIICASINTSISHGEPVSVFVAATPASRPSVQATTAPVTDPSIWDSHPSNSTGSSPSTTQPHPNIVPPEDDHFAVPFPSPLLTGLVTLFLVLILRRRLRLLT